VKEKINAIIVDDEIAFINTLKIILENYPEFRIIGQARSANEAVELIGNLEPDLIFLDVELGDGTGFDVLQRVERRDFKVIFVTAFDHYAVEAFRFSAIDYLLKPIVSADLDSALDKIKKSLSKDKIDYQFNVLLENIHNISNERKKIVLKELDTHHVVRLDNILYCVAEGSYTRFVILGGKTILVSRHLKEFERMMSGSGFFRTHRSHLANLNKIVKFEKGEGGILHIEENHKIPVSVRKKEKLSSLLSHL
jgi:two-component system LytT family response regulator